MRDFLKVIHWFSLLAKYGKVVKTFFLKLLLILSIRKLALYRDEKIWKFLFIYHKSISSFVHLTSQKVLEMAMFKN